MRPRTEKYPKQLAPNAQNLVCAPVTPTYSEGVQKTFLKTGLINCQSLCNKYDEIVDVVGEEGFDALVVTETWLSGGMSDQKIVGDVIPSIMQLAHIEKVEELSYSIGIL